MMYNERIDEYCCYVVKIKATSSENQLLKEIFEERYSFCSIAL